jgi:hypothetical protein
MIKMNRSLALGLLLVAPLAAPPKGSLAKPRAARAPAASSPRLPILDMHLHARRADHYGANPEPMCTPFERMPYWDPIRPIAEGLTFGDTPPCETPVPAAKTDDEVMRQTIAAMELRNVFGLLGG